MENAWRVLSASVRCSWCIDAANRKNVPSLFARHATFAGRGRSLHRPERADRP
jgi:hypothetical protein